MEGKIVEAYISKTSFSDLTLDWQFDWLWNCRLKISPEGHSHCFSDLQHLLLVMRCDSSLTFTSLSLNKQYLHYGDLFSYLYIWKLLKFPLHPWCIHFRNALSGTFQCRDSGTSTLANVLVIYLTISTSHIFFFLFLLFLEFLPIKCWTFWIDPPLLSLFPFLCLVPLLGEYLDYFLMNLF